ncbi:NAD(P)/FAD-dependent oxidoreductase [Alteribacillus sp. HJP-4]|uniref:NAD(P)/FAD-dependent oxidoreductase n=1 Tax=Alteribacillus sp. HJP-4 TaxID=2775394 RepID=UPI0035CCC9E6
MSINTDIVIIGGGIIGASTAHYLTNAGQKNVVLCEQDRPPGIGATKMSGGLIRMNHTNDIQTKLAWKSYSVFSNWSEIIGGSCDFNQSGFALLAGDNSKKNLFKNVCEMQKIGIPTTLITPDDFKKMQPYVSMKGVSSIAYEPMSGYGDPALAAASFINRAKQNGLELLEGTKVIELLVEGEKVKGVKTNIGDIYSEKVILCGGAWTAQLLQPLNVAIPLQRKQIGISFFKWRKDNQSNPLLTYIDDTKGCYFRSLSKDQILVGVSANNQESRSDELRDVLSTEDINKAYKSITQRISPKSFKPMGGRCGFDAYTPDKHPIIGNLNEVDGVYLATGFSGGGFKISPAVGQEIANELLEEKRSDLLTQLRLDRFEKKNLIKPKTPYLYM